MTKDLLQPESLHMLWGVCIKAFGIDQSPVLVQVVGLREKVDIR